MFRTTMRTMMAALALLAVTALPAHAAKYDILLANSLTQGEFDTFVDEAGYMIAYTSLAPAEPEGLLGFQAGISATSVNIDTAIWGKTLETLNTPSTLIVPRLQARKGLLFGIDVGASYIQVPSSNIKVYGAEVRKAILRGNMLFPAISLTAHGSQLQGVNDLDLKTYGVGVGVSKGFLMLTPYGGVDMLRVEGVENSPLVTLADVKRDITRVHVGMKFSVLPILNITVQADSRYPLGDIYTYSARVNIGL
ncbi:MAG: hypothetical protein OEY97_09940 [Nitrospirota bacterium]|nr:hypothetical protein [Nitrospirota bacterium]